MKFSIAALLVALPLLTQVAAGAVEIRQNQRFGGGRGGGKGGGATTAAAGGGKGGNNAAATSTSAAAAATDTAAAAAAQDAAIAAEIAAAKPATLDSKDPQTSLVLNPKVISTGFEQDGQAVPTPGQVASQTSSNNFINHCVLFPQLPLTNGKQITTGSCNTAPIGVIPGVNALPSAKFQNPPNGGNIPTANTAFNVVLNVKNLKLGNFANAKNNYFAAPQQVGNDGLIIGHTHVVIELLSSLDQTTPTDATKFAFFKGVNDAGTGTQVTVPVTAGLAAGPYRMCTINTSTNHVPVIGPIAQHGSFDDCSYFTVGGGGNGGNGGNGNNAAAGGGAAATTKAAVGGGAVASTTAAAAATTTAAAAGNGGGKGGKAAAIAAAASAKAAAAGGKGGATGGKGGAATTAAAAAATTTAVRGQGQGQGRGGRNQRRSFSNFL